MRKVNRMLENRYIEYMGATRSIHPILCGLETVAHYYWKNIFPFQ